MMRLLALVGDAIAGAVLLFLRLGAVLLSSSRTGLLIRAVSIPRMAEHRLRTSLTVLGIALGVGLLVAITTVNGSIMRGVLATVEDISGRADLQVASGSAGFDEDLVDKVSEVPGVAKMSPILQQVATLADPRAAGERLLVVGVDMLNKDDAHFRDYHSAGLERILDDPLPFLNSPYHLLISRTLAKRLNYKLDDKISIATGTGTHKFEIWGFLDESGVGRAFGGAIAVMYHNAMKVAFDRGNNIDRIDIAVDEGVAPAEVQRRLRKVLGEGFVVEQPATKGERIGRMLLGVQMALTMASLIALLVAAFLIHNTMAISVVQRRRELGTLRALGTRRAELVRMLTLEGALFGLAGSLLGIAFGLLLARVLLVVTSAALSEAYLQVAATKVHVSPLVVVGSGVLGVVFAAAAAALAAVRAGRINPVVSLRTAGLVQVAPITQGLLRTDLSAMIALAIAWLVLKLPSFGLLQPFAFVSAGALLLAGVLIIPRFVYVLDRFSRTRAGGALGLEARLAQANLPRDIGRTATTAGALMVGVAMAAAFATFIGSFTSTLYQWVDQTMTGDLFITNAASMTGMSLKEVPMSDGLRAELLAMPDVKSVRRLSVIEVPYRGYPIKVAATDVELYVKNSKVSTLEGSVDGALKGWLHGEISVSENFSRRFNVHLGDRVALSTNSGTRSFRVCAVLVDYTSDIGAIAMNRSTYVDAYGDTRVGTYELHLRPGADALKVRDAIYKRYGSEYDLFVLTNRELRSDIRGRIDQVFSLLRVLEFVALIVAVLGIVNAQLANVVDRIREIGLLRAVGMLRRQVNRLVLFEATFIGAIGAVLGLVVGMGLGRVILSYINLAATGWYFPYRVPILSFVEILVLTIAAAAAAGFYPARQAAGLVITNALEYE